VEFPARKQDLMRQARENGAEPAVLEVIEAMPEGEYASMADVMKGYGEADEAPQQGRRQERR